MSILQKLFTKIVVPKAVYQEITAKEQEKQIFDKTSWIQISEIKNTEVTNFLKKLLDEGEAEAIVLAKEMKTSLMVDDSKARKYAVLFNVNIIGTLGILKMAKNQGIISSVKEIIIDMQVKGYYIDERLVLRVLKDVCES